MQADFQTRVPGKWVLAGEHSVLKGATAIALPHPDFFLELRYFAGDQELQVEPASAQTVILELLQALRDEWNQDSRSFPSPRGLLQIESSIPIGAGLGSSAALCVAVARWLSGPLGISGGELFEFARKLEHRFHGRSSGMDVAVTLAAEAVSFVMNRGAEPLRIRRIPKFTFHDTGLRARTSECVMRVERHREESPLVAMKADDRMGAAARAAMEGLVRYDSGSSPEAALAQIASAMKMAQECYYQWELVPGEAKRLEERLLQQGALATKLTGAGGGGFVVALWPDASTQEVRKRP